MRAVDLLEEVKEHCSREKNLARSVNLTVAPVVDFVIAQFTTGDSRY